MRVTKLRSESEKPLALKTLRVGYAAARFPGEPKSAAVVATSGAATAEVRGGASGLDTARWTMRGDGTLQLDYAYSLEGEFVYHGITFDHPETAMEKLTWLGDGPYRVWQNRRRGSTLGIHAIARSDPQPGETFNYPEFQGYFAGLRWTRLDTPAGPLTVTSASPEIFLRVGTPRVTHPSTTIDFPSGDLSFVNAIPAIGSKGKSVDSAGPNSLPAKASGRYEGSLVFRFGN